MATNTTFTRRCASSPCAASRTATTISPTSTNSNPAKVSYHLLDLINEILNVSVALGQFQAAHAHHLPDAAVKHLSVMTESLELIADQSRRGVVNISRVKYLQPAHDRIAAAERKRKRDDPMRNIRTNTIWGLRALIKKHKISEKVMKKEATAPPPMPIYEEPRRSARGASTIFDPILLRDDFTGRPPAGAKAWTGEALVYFIDNLKTSNQMVMPYLRKIVERGMTEYKDPKSLNKMYHRWKKSGISPRGKGRPCFVEMDAIRASTMQLLKDRTSDSSTVKLKHIKGIIVNQKKKLAADNGLDPESVNASISTRWAKMTMGDRHFL